MGGTYRFVIFLAHTLFILRSLIAYRSDRLIAMLSWYYKLALWVGKKNFLLLLLFCTVC